MTTGEYISKYNKHLIDQTKNIVKGHEEYMDLYQSVVEQLLSNPDKFNEVPDDQKQYYFIKVTRTNWYSKTSPYQYQKKKYEQKHVTLFDHTTELQVDEEYVEHPTIDWVNEQVEQMSWFDRDLFVLWAELKTLSAVHRETTIPINSVGKYINEIKKELNERWTKR